MSFLCPRPSPCPACQGGRIGMRDCQSCEGTGTVFKVGSKTFPDTREGYDKAMRELEVDPFVDYCCG